jgi:hypothetical protein
MAKIETYLCIQCRTTCGQTGTFLTLDRGGVGPWSPLSPVFRDLYDLLQWARAHGWKSVRSIDPVGLYQRESASC